MPENPAAMVSASRLPTSGIVHLWVRLRGLLLILGIVLFSVIFLLTPRITPTYNIGALLPPYHPERKDWEKFKTIFGDEELLLVVYQDPGLFHPNGAGIAKARSIAERLRRIPGVRDVWSIDQPLGDLIAQPTSAISRSVHQLFEGYTHNARADLCAIVAVISQSAEIPQAITEIQTLVSTLPNGAVVGPIMLVHEAMWEAERDAHWLLWLVTGLLALVIFLISGRIRWVTTNLMIVGTAIVATQATLAFCGISYGFIGAPLSSIITVVGVATLMHVLTRFESYRTFGWNGEQSFSAVIQQLGKPVFLALATDCVGFGALSFSDIEPLREFSLMAVSGVGWLTVSIVLFLPGLALMRWQQKHIPQEKPHSRRQDSLTPRWTSSISKKLSSAVVVGWRFPIGVVLVVAAIFIVSISGLLRLEVETDFTRHFRARNKLVRTYELMERELGGAGIWDIAVPAPQALNREYMSAILRLEDRLRSEVNITTETKKHPGLTKVLSLADAVATLRQNDLFALTQPDIADAFALGMIRQRMPGLYHSLYAPDPSSPQRWWLRIMLRSPERQSAQSRRHTIEQVRHIVSQEWPAIMGTLGRGENDPLGDIANDVKPFVTGYFVIFGVVVESLLRDQNTTFFLAVAGMFAVFWIAFRDIRMVVILLVCNVLPIVCVLGALGWCGVRVNLGVAMMAAVALGLSVDSSLHYITVYQRLLRTGIGPIRSIFHCQMLIGPPVIYATLALCVGFLSLIFSQLMPTVFLGILLSFTMIAGLLSNVTLLPWLLLISCRKNLFSSGSTRLKGQKHGLLQTNGEDKATQRQPTS